MELPSFCMKWRGATWHQNLRVFCPVFQDGPCMKWCWFFHFIRGMGSSIPYRYSQGGLFFYICRCFSSVGGRRARFNNCWVYGFCHFAFVVLLVVLVVLVVVVVVLVIVVVVVVVVLVVVLVLVLVLVVVAVVAVVVLYLSQLFLCLSIYLSFNNCCGCGGCGAGCGCGCGCCGCLGCGRGARGGGRSFHLGFLCVIWHFFRVSCLISLGLVWGVI